MIPRSSPHTSAQGITTAPLDRGRYRRVLWFFGRLMLDLVWWEIVLRHILGERVAARTRPARLRSYARSFRRLAVEMGGVLIKLGQFISARVDIMPPAITDELADLQDEVPPQPLEVMLSVLEAELGAPPEHLFAEFDREVQAAASLGQVYRARLRDGERVVVKIQRPGIENRVATDLAALRQVARWTMYWSVVRKRADVPALLDEFARTLWQELDYVSEADHAERFRQLFENDPRVYVPSIFRNYSTRRVITLEDVTSIKITDYNAIEAAGVDRALAAQYLLDVYLRMIFDFGYFHADPHPGNLFIYPLPPEAVSAMADWNCTASGHPFYVVFIDFGMVGMITDRMKDGLRTLLVAVATRDAHGVLEGYQKLGMLLPGADLERIEQAEQEILDMIWGRTVPDLAKMHHSEMRAIAMKYRDLMYEMPFQVPQDFIYLARAVGILSGICTGLDPEFNPWEPIAEYAQRLVMQETHSNFESWVREAAKLGQVALGLPRQMQDVLDRIQRGELHARIDAAGELQRDLRRLELAINSMTRALVFSSLLIAATLLTIAGREPMGMVTFALAGIAWLVLALRRRS